ncbi:MAG: vitamin K epoxide reductase family protein [Thermoleophilia bacterium]|nr:vitamin K epoxide reductase family protein [Gaiellaceae bacterium]MDW8338042.1 vitamin K epoxide reductase family protein [Thermoleophilia bacterium]
MSDHVLRAAAALVALAGLGVASYLAWARLADTSVICVAGGGCEQVQSSEYAELLGVPVAVLGAGAYATLLLLLLWDVPLARLAAASLSFFALLFSAYLLILQLVVIDAICIWCLANDVLIAPALAALTALRLRSLRT